MQLPHLRHRQVRALLVAAAAAAPHVAQAAAQEVTYQLEFEGNWTTASTPGGVVRGAHFTTLIGAVHSGDVTFWSSGSMASAGVEEVAEVGGVATFRSEVRASPHTRSVIQEGVSGGGTGSTTFTITLTPSHPRVTLLSMIGPSPDWFVGVSGVSLLDSPDNWRDEHVVDLYPYDAGTEDGTEFTLSNPPTSPQGVIRSIRGRGKFSNVRMARLTFTRQRSDPEASFASGSSSAAEDAGTRDVTVNLSPGPDAELTLRYTLSGTATGGSDYTIAGVTGSSGTVAVAAGQTSVSVPVAITDDNAEEGAETVVLTLAAGDGYTVGSPAVHTLTITDNDPTGPTGNRPPLVIVSCAPCEVEPGGEVRLTAEASDADGDPLTYAWSAPAGRFVGGTDGATARWTAPPETGRYRVGVRVSDGEGGSTEATALVTVALPNRPPAAVGTIPDQTLEARGEAATVDLAAYFEDLDGEALAFRATSSDTAVVMSAVEGPVLTLTPVSAGSALVTVSAEDAAGETAMQAFGVAVGKNRMEGVVLEETLAAVARSQLASARMAVGRRVRRPRAAAGPDALVMGGAIPPGREEGWAGLRGVAERWLSARAPLRPGHGDGTGGIPMLPGPGHGAAGTPSLRETPVSWPEITEGTLIAAGSDALFRETEFEVVWGGQEGASGNRWALWGEGDVQTFAGAPSGATDYDGDVRTGYVGIDTELTDRWLVGAAVSRSRGGGDWRAGAGRGRLESTLTTAQPYARWSDGATSIWMLAGRGRGELENLAGAADQNVSGLDLGLGLIELRRRVGNAAGVEVAIRADAGWAELASEEGEGSADGLEAAVNQARMGADISRTMGVGALVLEPFGEAHIRRDGGAGQTGSGLEVAGGLRAVAGAVRIDAQGRLLAVHSAEGYRERGAGLSLAVGGQGAEGLSLAVSSHWGDTGAGTGVLWENGGLHGGSLPGPETAAWTLDARGSYGLRLGSRLLSWFGTVGRSTGESRLTIGGRFGNANR